MRHTVEVPRPVEPKPVPTPPLEASPVELRRERLNAKAQDREALPISRPFRVRSQQLERAREPKQRSLPHSVEHRQRRDQMPAQAIGVSLRREEMKVLTEAGRFRVVRVSDLRETVYGGNGHPLERDLRYLRQRGLVETHFVNARRDGRLDKVERIEVVTLTNAGRGLVRQTGELPSDQVVYAGLVKPREAEHDAQIYRAYLKEASRIEDGGGSNLRVKLDFELKSEVQKAVYSAKYAAPERDGSEIKREVAAHFELPYTNERIQFPDARIVYDQKQDQDQGSRSGHADIEVLTAAYRSGHLQAKAQSGFHLYASSADRSGIDAKIEDEHGMTRDILDL